MRSTRLRIAAILTLFFAVPTAVIASTTLLDVTGKWIVSSTSPNGPVSSTLVLKQEGKVLSGTITIDGIGSSAVSGERNGDTVRYSFVLDVQGMQLPVGVFGILQDSNTMSGNVNLPEDMGSYPFTGKRETSGN